MIEECIARRARGREQHGEDGVSRKLPVPCCQRERELTRIFTLRRVGSSRRQQWFVVGSHLVAGGVGIVVLGLLATSMGFLFTGSIALIINQVAGTVLVTLYSTAVSVALWLPLRWAVKLAAQRVTAT